MLKLHVMWISCLTLLMQRPLASYSISDHGVYPWPSGGVIPSFHDTLLLKSSAQQMINLNYDNTDVYLEGNHNFVDNNMSKMRLSKFVSQELQDGSTKEQVLRYVLHQVLGEHRKRQSQMKKQVMSNGSYNEKQLRKWFILTNDGRNTDSILTSLVLDGVRNGTKELFSSESHEKDFMKKKKKSHKKGILSIPGKRLKRDEKAVMYLPVGSTGDGSDDCPDSVDAAAVSISQLVFLSLCLGVFTAVANVANNINNNNNNNNNNNDNNINSNNLNFAANANAGNQITVQVPPGRKKRDLILQNIISRIYKQTPTEIYEEEGRNSHLNTSRVSYESLKDLKSIKTTRKSSKKIMAEKNVDTNSTSFKMSLEYEMKNPNLFISDLKISNNTKVRLQLVNDSNSTKEDIENKTFFKPVLLEKHFDNIREIANRHNYFIHLQDIPSLLQRHFAHPSPLATLQRSGASSPWHKRRRASEYPQRRMENRANSVRIFSESPDLARIPDEQNLSGNVLTTLLSSSTTLPRVSASVPSSELPTTPNSEGVGAVWALKAAMQWAMSSPLVMPECLGLHLCQRQHSGKDIAWMSLITGYTLQKAVAGKFASTFPEFITEVRLKHCHELFPNCSSVI